MIQEPVTLSDSDDNDNDNDVADGTEGARKLWLVSGSLDKQLVEWEVQY